MNMRISRTFLLCLGATVTTSCTTYRAAKATSWEKANSLNECSSPKEIRKVAGGPDKLIDVPGGGRIEIHDFLVSSSSKTTNVPLSAGAALITLGFSEFATSLNNIDCSGACNYGEQRTVVHYAPSGAIACLEVKVLRTGEVMTAKSRETSSCPMPYKTALAREVDVSDLPTSSIAGDPEKDAQAASLPPSIQADLLAIAREARCSNYSN